MKNARTVRNLLSAVLAASVVLTVPAGVMAAAKPAAQAKSQAAKTQYVSYPSSSSVLKLKKGYKDDVVLKEMKPIMVQVMRIFGGYYTATNKKASERNAAQFNAFVDKAIPDLPGFDIEGSKREYVMRRMGSLDETSEKDLVKLGKELQLINANTKIDQEIIHFKDDDTVVINYVYHTKVAGSPHQVGLQFQFKPLNKTHYALELVMTF